MQSYVCNQLTLLLVSLCSNDLEERMMGKEVLFAEIFHLLAELKKILRKEEAGRICSSNGSTVYLSIFPVIESIKHI